jgi:ribosomal protein S18 acetylase RimI-like enzyme
MYRIDTIRVRTPREIGRVAALAREIWTEYYTPLIGSEQVGYMLENFQSAEAISAAIHNDGVKYDLTSDGEYDIAYCAALPEDDSLFISKVYVRSKYRNMGVARRLLRRALSENPKTRKIWLTVNKGNQGAIEAYKRMGFTIEKEIVTDIGGGFVMDDYLMVRPFAYGMDL